MDKLIDDLLDDRNKGYKQNKFEISYSREDLICYYKNKFVLEWCKQNHPQILEKAVEIIEEYIKEDEE